MRKLTSDTWAETPKAFLKRVSDFFVFFHDANIYLLSQLDSTHLIDDASEIFAFDSFSSTQVLKIFIFVTLSRICSIIQLF